MGECGDEMRVWTAESSMTSLEEEPCFPSDESPMLTVETVSFESGVLFSVDHDC